MFKLFSYIKVFFRGFHYGIKKYDIIEDHHFHTYTYKDTILSQYGNSIHSMYRRGIKSGRLYFLYRLELLALFYLFIGVLILLTL